MLDIPRKSMIIYSKDMHLIENRENLNNLAADGCSGVLHLQTIPGGRGSVDELLDNLLLDLPDNKYRTDIKESDVLIISDHIDNDLCDGYRVRSIYDRDLVEAISKALNEDSFVFIVVMMNSISKYIDQIILEIMNKNGKSIVFCLIANANLLTARQFVIPQSFQYKSDKLLPLEGKKFIFTCWSKSFTRRDLVTCFNSDEINSKGGNGNILAYHLMSELAFIVGKTSKYGA